MFRLIDHLHRLEASARMLRIPSPYPVPELVAAAELVVTCNGHRSRYVRPMLWRGLGAMGMPGTAKATGNSLDTGPPCAKSGTDFPRIATWTPHREGLARVAT